MYTKRQKVNIDDTRFIFQTNFSGDPERDRFGSDQRRVNVVIPTEELAQHLLDAPKRKGGKAEDYSDEELRARINRLQMEKQYRDLQGDTNIRADDPNRELKAEKERLQLQKDVKQLRSDVYGGQSFVKSVMKDAGKQFLTKAVAGAMSYSAKQFVTSTFENPDLANAIVSGSASGGQTKQDDKKN